MKGLFTWYGSSFTSYVSTHVLLALSKISPCENTLCFLIVSTNNELFLTFIKIVYDVLTSMIGILDN